MNNDSGVIKQFEASDGVTISYHLKRKQNTQLTLVMLHGLASNGTRWSEFVQNTRLSDYLNLLWLDLRGHGQSMIIEPINHAIWLKDLYAVLQQESLSKVILVGHSMGAQLALYYALQHPSMVQGIILIDPTLPKKLRGKLAVARRFRFIIRAWIKLLLILNKLFPRRRVYPQRDLRVLDTKTRQLMEQHSPDIIARLYSSPQEDLKYIPLVNYLQDVYAVTGDLPDLTKIRCPIQVVLSKGSTIVEAGNIKNYLSPQTQIEFTEIDANHWPLTEKPEETKLAIDNWCLKQIETTKCN